MAPVTPPIDVLEIAAVRYAEARAYVRATLAMQAGPAAEAAYQEAAARVDATRRDVTAAQDLAAYLDGLPSS